MGRNYDYGLFEVRDGKFLMKRPGAIKPIVSGKFFVVNCKDNSGALSPKLIPIQQ